jgi:pimeloyl-ACP methyl ester carboxylesterase
MKLEMISKYPADEQRPTPLLFIHGTLHTASCWDVHFLDYFAQHGYASHAVNLRGHRKGRLCLRPQYNERKRIGTGLRMSWLALSSLINVRGASTVSGPTAS